MKTQTTQKAIKQQFKNDIIKTGYCNLQNLLSYEQPTNYTTRAEGWASDVYKFTNYAISAGYKPFGNIKPDYDLCNKYDNKARDIINNSALKYDEQKELLYNLINEFIQEATK